MRIISLPRAWIRKLLHNNQSLGVSVCGAKLPISFQDEPIETRIGLKNNDKSDFYESNFDKLYHFYSGYQNTDEYHQGLLYTDIIALSSEDVYPIRKVSMQTKNIQIHIDRLSYKLPVSLKEHSVCAIQSFKDLKKIKKDRATGDWENNEALRFDKICLEKCVIEARKAYYFDQVATNITLDWRSKKLPDTRLTIRNSPLLERPIDGKLRPLENSTLANTLGVAVMLFSSNLEAFVRVRCGSMASITKEALHCSASGVFEMEGGIKAGKYDFSIFVKGIQDEIKSEIGLSETDYNLFPIAFARELPRGGKPQLFFIAVTSLTTPEVIEKSKSADESWEFIDVEDENLSGFKSSIELSDEPMKAFTYEGWACLKLAEDFIEVNPNLLSMAEN